MNRVRERWESKRQGREKETGALGRKREVGEQDRNRKIYGFTSASYYSVSRGAVS